MVPEDGKTPDLLSGDILNHTFTKRYLNSLLSNVRVVRYLAKHHGEVPAKFQNITQIE